MKIVLVIMETEFFVFPFCIHDDNQKKKKKKAERFTLVLKDIYIYIFGLVSFRIV